MRIALFSHCNFLGNSAMHVFNIAEGLQKLGHSCVIAVPDSPETVLRFRDPSFPIALYADVIENPRLGGAPDLVHAWSPREHVRIAVEAFVAQHKCPYFVHMEDNEEQIVADEFPSFDYKAFASLPDDLLDALIEPYRSHPRRYPRFVAGAAGMTSLIDRLLEFSPEGQPKATFLPGFDEAFASISSADLQTRARYGIQADEIVFLYSGNIHPSIVDDVRRLYLALLILRRKGHRVRLIKTGWNYAEIDVPEASDFTIDLGFVDRSEISVLLSLADILVQPGKPDSFNDYRVPSKLPEYLASGKPVILPNSNIGLLMEDGKHALKLYAGSVDEIVKAIERLVGDRDLMARIGAEGRAFAIETLSWQQAAATLDEFYKKALAKSDATPPPDMDDPQQGSNKSAFPVKLIAFYLPQFHPIPENDLWWGKGFTEWTNVGKARPQYPGHDHPRRPTELGYYDLRVVEVMHEQVALANAYGVHAFCFYYYWFSGHRLLERPVDIWMSERAPNFPFVICWANENWSRRWDGSETDILMPQLYRPEDDEAFIRNVLPILKDPRYVRVNGAPMLLVYRVTLLPDPLRTVSTWRRICAENGIDHIHLCAVQSFGIGDPRPFGFDAAVEFPPPHVGRQLADPAKFKDLLPTFNGYIEDYISVALRRIHDEPQPFIHYRGVTPCWDNTARRGSRGHILVNSSPKAYGQWLRFLAKEALLRADQQEPFVFINAWNEWAEGAYLEPDERYGRALLEVTRDSMCEAVIDYIKGPDDERERAFNQRISRIPLVR